MEDNNLKKWSVIMATVKEINEWFPDGVVFIGGVAVYCHIFDNINFKQYCAYSHDADFMILLKDYMDLRDIEILTSNPRLSKQQFIKNQVEFDVYVERQHSLVVPVEEVVSFSTIKNGIRVASLEHLLILKAKAYSNRKGSSKGNKDEDDIFKIFLLMDNFDEEQFIRLTEDLVDNIDKIPFIDSALRLTNNNKHLAKNLKQIVEKNWENIKCAMNSKLCL